MPAATAPPLPPERFTIFVDTVAGAGGDGPTELANALSSELRRAGGGRVNDAGRADYVVKGEATVGPAVQGRQTVAIIWTVTTRSGSPLGTVRQVNHVAPGSLDRQWGQSAQRAAEAAAPGVLALLPER